MSTLAAALPRVRLRRWRPRRDRVYAIAAVTVCLLYILLIVHHLMLGQLPELGSLAIWLLIYSREHRTLRKIWRSKTEVPIRGRDWLWLVFAWCWLALVVAFFGI